MTLDETIKNYEKVAEEKEKQAIKVWSKEDNSYYENCIKVVKELRQLAEWLKELKESRIVLDILGQFLVDADLDVCCEDLVMEDDYCEKNCDNRKPLCWYRWAKAKAREVNADENDS